MVPKVPNSFQFYLMHGHTNVTRSYDTSLAEWSSFQRRKLVQSGDKYDPKYKHILDGIDLSCVSPPSPNEVFDNNLAI
jgi:hypothetical protein